MKKNNKIAYTIIAKTIYNCRYSELKSWQQKIIAEKWEDLEELLYNFWKKGHRVWRED